MRDEGTIWRDEVNRLNAELQSIKDECAYVHHRAVKAEAEVERLRALLAKHHIDSVTGEVSKLGSAEKDDGFGSGSTGGND